MHLFLCALNVVLCLGMSLVRILSVNVNLNVNFSFWIFVSIMQTVKSDMIHKKQYEIIINWVCLVRSLNC